MLESFIDRITRASLRFKWVTIGLSILALVAGGFALTQLNQELIPKIEFPQSILIAVNPGMDPETLRDEVTIPIEDAVRDIEGVVNVESTTSSGLAFIIIRNEFGMDQDAIRTDITNAIETLTYPQGMDIPELLTFSLSDLPIAILSVSSPDLSLIELKALVEAEIVPELVAIADVADVSVSGGQELPTPPPPTPEPTEEPEPTPPPPTPTEVPTEVPEIVGVALPESWIEAAASQNVTISTVDDLTPELVEGIVGFAPQLLEDLTPEMLLAMPLETLAVLPEDYLGALDPELGAQIAERLSLLVEPEPVPLPDSWIAAAASQNMTLETTADLTPELVGGIASFAPQLLDDLTPEMLLAMPLDALAALPEDYLASLDPELAAQLAERLALAPAPTEFGELPAAWQSAGQQQGVSLVYPADVTPEVIQAIASLAPFMLDQLTPDNLRGFSPEVLAWLPQQYIETLDPDLQAELDVLAEPAGGLGALADQAETVELPSDAPELSGLWRETPEEGATVGMMPSFETAADLIDSGFAPSAASLLNLLVESGQEMAPQLIADLTPDVITWLTENETGFLENLSPTTLRLFSPEVLADLPEEFLSTLDTELQAELEGIATGTVEAFIPTETINRVNGNPSLAMSIYKDNIANTVSVSHEVFDKLEEFEAENTGLRFDMVFEQSSFIEESISGVAREGTLGAIFAVIVILIFLSGLVNGKYRLSWQSTLVTAVSIPLSVFMAFALFKYLPPAANVVLEPLASATASIPILGAITSVAHRLFPVGITLNIMTLSGMTVAVGRVVDDSIVVLENIYRHIQRGEDMKQSVLVGTRDVAIAIFASTVTTVVVFLPIGLLGGLVGQFFLPFGVAVTYALGSSFLVAVTIVPLLAFLFIRKEQLPEEGESILQRWYTPILKWALKYRAITLAIAAIFLAGSMYLLAQRPRAFLPDFGEVQITTSIQLPNGTTMAETDEAVVEFETALAKIDGVGTIQSEIGSSGGLVSRFLGGAIDQAGATTMIKVEDTDEVDSLAAEIRQLAETLFGTENVTVSSGSLTSAAFGSFALVLSGEPGLIADFNDEAIAALDEIEGLTNVTSNLADVDM
ncbi:MAG: efflux RND transporter permease subunit, partial [Anaerolineaceae bacterium]